MLRQPFPERVDLGCPTVADVPKIVGPSIGWDTEISVVRFSRGQLPNSTYASFEHCSCELRQAEVLYRAHRIPVINTSAKPVEEMSTIILQTINRPRQRQKEYS